MAKIFDLFKRRRRDEPTPRSFEEIFPEVKQHASPALSLRKVNGPSASWLGGDPRLPPGVEWPKKEDQHLTFLACFDMAQVAAAGVTPLLPESGRLLFFYDADNQPWGFDPADRGGWSVLHVEEVGPAAIPPTATLPKVYVRFEPVDSLPDWQRFEDLGIVLAEGELETYDDGYYEWLGDREVHQIGGYPKPIQNDTMELECQLASNGIDCGGAEGYQSDEAKQLASGASDWLLLLQYASDEDVDVMWGDLGDLYFWIRAQDLKERDFSNVWVVLQCH